jgi:hypothetical protein
MGGCALAQAHGLAGQGPAQQEVQLRPSALGAPEELDLALDEGLSVDSVSDQPWRSFEIPARLDALGAQQIQLT